MATSLYRTSLVVVASAFGAFFASAAAADIYTWTDERGTTVISDTPPANAKRVTDLQVVVREEKKSGKRAGARDATATEQKLLDRIDNLERQVRAQAPAQTYSSLPSAGATLPPAVSYYTPPVAPQPYYDPYYYDSGYYAPSYYPGYYPSYYPYSYGFPGAVIVGRGFGGHRGHGHFVNRPIVAPRGAGVVGRGRR